jgi:hypothetical protein
MMGISEIASSKEYIPLKVHAWYQKPFEHVCSNYFKVTTNLQKLRTVPVNNVTNLAYRHWLISCTHPSRRYSVVQYLLVYLIVYFALIFQNLGVASLEREIQEIRRH